MAKTTKRWINFDDDSLELLVNESYDNIQTELKEVNAHLALIKDVIGNTQLLLETYGEQYIETLKTKQNINSELLRLAQLVLTKNRTIVSASEGNAFTPTPEMFLNAQEKANGYESTT